MKYILTLLMLTVSLQGSAKVTKLNLEATNIPYQRDYYIPNHTQWGYSLSLNMDVHKDLFNYNGYHTVKWFLESDITGHTRNNRFRNMWWRYVTGFSITPDIDIIWKHKSQHTLDEQVDFNNDRYPVSDSYGIRFNFLEVID